MKVKDEFKKLFTELKLSTEELPNGTQVQELCHRLGITTVNTKGNQHGAAGDEVVDKKKLAAIAMMSESSAFKFVAADCIATDRFWSNFLLNSGLVEPTYSLKLAS